MQKKAENVKRNRKHENQHEIDLKKKYILNSKYQYLKKTPLEMERHPEHENIIIIRSRRRRSIICG